MSKIEVSAGLVPLGGSEGLSASLWWLLAVTGVPRLADTSLQSLPCPLCCVPGRLSPQIALLLWGDQWLPWGPP